MIKINDVVSFEESGYNNVIIKVESDSLHQGSLDVYGDLTAIRTLATLLSKVDTRIVLISQLPNSLANQSKYWTFIGGFGVNLGEGADICYHGTAGIAIASSSITTIVPATFRFDGTPPYAESNGIGYCEFSVEWIEP